MDNSTYGWLTYNGLPATADSYTLTTTNITNSNVWIGQQPGTIYTSSPYQQQPQTHPYWRSLQNQQAQQVSQYKYWMQMLNNQMGDPKENEISLLREIRARAQYYAMMLLLESGLAA